MRDEGGWNAWTLQQFSDQVAKAAAGLQAAGIGAGEQVLLMMRNRPDFHWFDAAAQFLRATPVSIYNSSSPEEIQYLAGHAEARVAIVEDAGFLDRILQVRADLPALERVYVIEPPARAASRRRVRRRPNCSTPARQISRRSPPPPNPTTSRR